MKQKIHMFMIIAGFFGKFYLDFRKKIITKIPKKIVFHDFLFRNFIKFIKTKYMKRLFNIFLVIVGFFGKFCLGFPKKRHFLSRGSERMFCVCVKKRMFLPCSANDIISEVRP